MSTLREAAQAVVDQWDTPNWKLVVHTGVLIDRLRAALAQPVAWMYDWFSDGEVVRDWVTLDRDEAHSPTMGCHNIRPLYTHQPRDEWRPASEPPDSTRSVLIWLKFGDVETFGKTLGGPSGFAFQNGAITHWRDVTPPTEGAK